jgi:hypothetical protein
VAYEEKGGKVGDPHRPIFLCTFHFPAFFLDESDASGRIVYPRALKYVSLRPIYTSDFRVRFRSKLVPFTVILPLNMLAFSPAAVLGDLKTRTNLFYLESRSEYLFFTVHKRVFARNVTKRNAKTD